MRRRSAVEDGLQRGTRRITKPSLPVCIGSELRSLTNVPDLPQRKRASRCRTLRGEPLDQRLSNSQALSRLPLCQKAVWRWRSVGVVHPSVEAHCIRASRSLVWPWRNLSQKAHRASRPNSHFSSLIYIIFTDHRHLLALRLRQVPLPTACDSNIPLGYFWPLPAGLIRLPASWFLSRRYLVATHGLSDGHA